MTLVHHGQLSVKTARNTEVIDITGLIRDWVQKQEIKDGILTVSSMHTTAGVTINEGENRLMQDIGDQLLKLVPRGAGYQHDRVDNNAHAHIAATLIGPSVTLSILSGSLGLGTWQRVLFVECDGPRQRTVRCTIIGD
jgi:secondary thiamine-phosphate synthase enzyme